MDRIVTGNSGTADGWYHPQCSPLATVDKEQWVSEKHSRCPSIDSDLILQRIVTSSPGKSFGMQIEHHQQEQVQYSYIKVETSSPLVNITPESLPMLEALCRKPELLKRLAEGVTEVNSISCKNVCGSGAQTQMTIPTGTSSPILSPSLPSYNVDSSFSSPGMTMGFKAPVFEINMLPSESGSCSRTDSPSISCDMDANFIDTPQVERELQECIGHGCEGFMDPRGNESKKSSSQREPGIVQEDTFNSATQKNGKVRRVKSNGPQENQNRRGLPRNIVKRLSWWLCQHAKNPYPTKNEKAELASTLAIDKNQQQYDRLLKAAEEGGHEDRIVGLQDVIYSCANISAPNLISLFDKQAIEHLEQAILDAFETGFNEI